MGNQKNTIATEDAHSAPFFNKTTISIERGEGLYVWDEEGNEYVDFTAGWGVTCLGHAHPVITEALAAQSRKIMQNPNSGITYSPARARLLSLLMEILPRGLPGSSSPTAVQRPMTPRLNLPAKRLEG